MRARVCSAHSSIRDHWALRYMSRCPDQVVSLKRDSQCLRPQASLVLIYRPIAVCMKGCSRPCLARGIEPGPVVWKRDTLPLDHWARRVITYCKKKTRNFTTGSGSVINDKN
ncbi:hypothetical protein TNCV_3823341 [Trichonephila clavipes]|nr:hypothetical protein TNCV_3823341 [Trichonephila clavipes]